MPVPRPAGRFRPLLLVCLTAAGVALGGCIRQEKDPAPTATVDDTFSVVTAEPAWTDEEEEQQTYTVQEGDTLSAIAEEFGVSERALIEANNLDDPDDIRVGQTLIVP
jgi:LysM repeat protein